MMVLGIALFFCEHEFLKRIIEMNFANLEVFSGRALS